MCLFRFDEAKLELQAYSSGGCGVSCLMAICLGDNCTNSLGHEDTYAANIKLELWENDREYLNKHVELSSSIKIDDEFLHELYK